MLSIISKQTCAVIKESVTGLPSLKMKKKIINRNIFTTIQHPRTIIWFRKPHHIRYPDTCKCLQKHNVTNFLTNVNNSIFYVFSFSFAFLSLCLSHSLFLSIYLSLSLSLSVCKMTVVAIWIMRLIQ